MSSQLKNLTNYDSPIKINEAFIETFLRIQKACKINQELSNRVEQYFSDKTKFKLFLARPFESSE